MANPRSTRLSRPHGPRSDSVPGGSLVACTEACAEHLVRSRPRRPTLRGGSGASDVPHRLCTRGSYARRPGQRIIRNASWYHLGRTAASPPFSVRVWLWRLGECDRIHDYGVSRRGGPSCHRLLDRYNGSSVFLVQQRRGNLPGAPQRPAARLNSRVGGGWGVDPRSALLLGRVTGAPDTPPRYSVTISFVTIPSRKPSPVSGEYRSPKASSLSPAGA